jgi:hypothetical protein
VYLISESVFLATDSALASLVFGVYFLRHPMPFVLDVISQDGYVVLFGLLTLRFYLKRNLSQPFPASLNPSSTDFFLFSFDLFSSIIKRNWSCLSSGDYGISIF